MYVGVDYYPEHWPKSRWAVDAQLMREAGLNVVRLAEFAWVNMEPEEGRYEFAWLDEALKVLGENGISVILGTPTAVMPAWCARKYPETLRMEKSGSRVRWGVRKNNCMSSPTYRHLSTRITRAMCEHFRDAANVIGWQTDNEFGGDQCYCPACAGEFRDWLKGKYQTLDELNRAWGTHFWGHTYQRWDEIPLPDNEGGSNPSAWLDWKRFNSWNDVRFQHEQVEIMREVCPKQFVTHNLMGMFPHLDYYDLAKDLDHVSWDNYPIGENITVPYVASFAADIMRGVKRKNFWIMEQTVGPHGWGTFGRNVRPGEIFKIAMQQIGHGADHIVWFRWRSCTVGREQYWHGVLGHDGRPLRRYEEVKQCATNFRKIEKELEGTTPKSKVAIIYDYDCRWAMMAQPSYDGSKSRDVERWWSDNYVEAIRRYYSALMRAGVNVDVIHPSQDLSEYKVVLAPHLYLMTDELAQRLNAFVANGGVLLADCRTGVKDATSLCHERTLPGLLGESLGIEIEEYESLNGATYAARGSGALEGTWTAGLFCDWITCKGAEALGAYEPWHVQRFALATRNQHGKGTGYYVGTLVQESAFYDRLMADVLATAGVQPVMRPPAGVEVCVREGDGRQLLFVINHLESEQSVELPQGATDLLGGEIGDGKLKLGAFGVAVVRMR